MNAFHRHGFAISVCEVEKNQEGLTVHLCTAKIKKEMKHARIGGGMRLAPRDEVRKKTKMDREKNRRRTKRRPLHRTESSSDWGQVRVQPSTEKSRSFLQPMRDAGAGKKRPGKKEIQTLERRRDFRASTMRSFAKKEKKKRKDCIFVLALLICQ